MFKIVIGLAFFTVLPIIMGVWLLGAVDKTTGMFTIMAGIAFLIFAVGALVGIPGVGSTRTEASPD